MKIYESHQSAHKEALVELLYLRLLDCDCLLGGLQLTTSVLELFGKIKELSAFLFDVVLHFESATG